MKMRQSYMDSLCNIKNGNLIILQSLHRPSEEAGDIHGQ